MTHEEMGEPSLRSLLEIQMRMLSGHLESRGWGQN